MAAVRRVAPPAADAHKYRRGLLAVVAGAGNARLFESTVRAAREREELLALHQQAEIARMERFGSRQSYPAGAAARTCYSYEPWHLRYVGRELARAYHEGGWTSLEEFFALPPAPDYAE